MEYLAPGICGLLLILGLVGVVMGRSVWRVPQMLLVIGILIGSAVFFWLAVRTLKTHETWQKLLAEYRQDLQQVEKGKFAGSQLVQKGIEQLQDENVQLNREVTVALANRGRVWHDATSGCASRTPASSRRRSKTPRRWGSKRRWSCSCSTTRTGASISASSS